MYLVLEVVLYCFESKMRDKIPEKQVFVYFCEAKLTARAGLRQLKFEYTARARVIFTSGT